MADYDSPFKEVLDKFFAVVVRFLMPKAHDDIDWTKDHESLETELRKVLPESEGGLKRVDKLVKVFRKGSEDWAYLHVEAQMFPEDDFARRMYVYNNKAEEVYNSPIVSFAILGDERADWRPGRYHFELWGCTKAFTFPSVKLLKWRGKERRLEKDKSPFAVFVLAHLQALATKHDAEQRARWKERLMSNIALRELDNEDRREWLRLVDWLLELPRDRNLAIWQRVWALIGEKEKTMPFVDYFQEREQLATQQGEERGEKRGEKRGLLKGIQAMLRVRLPEQEEALIARVKQLDDPEVLGRVLDAAEAGDIAQLEKLLPRG
jgi:hypothetical protein